MLHFPTQGKKADSFRLSIHPLIHGLSFRWCPMSPHFLTRLVSRLLGWLWYPGLLPVLMSIDFPFAFHISVLFHSLFTCHWISFVFFLYGRRICTHSVDPSLTHFLSVYNCTLQYLEENPMSQILSS